MCTAIVTMCIVHALHGASKFSPDVNTVRARAARGTLHQSSLAASRAGGAARVGSYYRLKIRVNLKLKFRGPAAPCAPPRPACGAAGLWLMLGYQHASGSELAAAGTPGPGH